MEYILSFYLCFLFSCVIIIPTIYADPESTVEFLQFAELGLLFCLICEILYYFTVKTTVKCYERLRRYVCNDLCVRCELTIPVGPETYKCENGHYTCSDCLRIIGGGHICISCQTTVHDALDIYLYRPLILISVVNPLLYRYTGGKVYFRSILIVVQHSGGRKAIRVIFASLFILSQVMIWSPVMGAIYVNIQVINNNYYSLRNSTMSTQESEDSGFSKIWDMVKKLLGW